MKKKILIIYATYGSGHKAIANYISKYLKNQDEELEIMLLDMINYGKISGILSKKISENLMLKHPKVWDVLFKLSDHKYTSHFSNKVSMTWFNKLELKKIIQNFNPDLTISTHFYGSTLITKFNQEKVIRSELITIITDYEAHDMWLDHYNGKEYIVVSSKDDVKELLKHKISKNHIKDFGIPIYSDNISINKDEYLKNLKLDYRKMTCLCFAGGGNGSVKTLPYIKNILKTNKDLNYIFIAGKNDKAYKKIKSYVKKYQVEDCLVYGYVNNVLELIQVSDFVVTKPGGAQTTECLYYKKPMLFIKSSGGQENYNVSYFSKKGYAKFFKSPLRIKLYFKRLNYNLDNIKRMQKNLKKVDSNNSMKKLYSLVKEVLK